MISVNLRQTEEYYECAHFTPNLQPLSILLMVSEDSGYPRSSRYSNTKKKFQNVADSTLDDGVLETLSAILASLEEDGSLKDYEPLMQFFRKGFAVQAVQSWSYYAQIGNHSKFTSSTKILAMTLNIVGSQAMVHEYGSILIRLIITDHVEVLYKGINNMRASLTNSIIALMKEMILFGSGTFVEEMITNFDFSLPSLSKVLTINKSDMPVIENGGKTSKLSMRHELIDFWLLLLSLSSPLQRRDLLTENPRIVGSWFKFMDKADSIATMKRTIDILSEKILKEPVFKRMTKTKVLNELALSKIHSFYSSSDKDLVKKVNEFFLIYGSDPKFSVAIPDDCVWFSESPLSGIRRGVTVAINQNEFQVYNKLLFNILKFFKPWEDDVQSATVSKILDNVPELVAPYCSFLSSLGSHDPKMTSYWFGCTMMIGRIIRLKIPVFMEQIQTDVSPSTSLVMQNILPTSLTRSALIKALSSERLLIRQLSCQLIVFSFQKLEKVLNLYDSKGWIAAKSSLRNAFHSVIPDSTMIAQVINQAYTDKKDNKIMQLTLTTILKLYSKIFPNFFSVTFSPSNIFVDIIRASKFSGMDLAILDNFLQFQEMNGTQMKWWQKTSSDYSLFVSLLMLSIKSNYSVKEKIGQLLENMFHGTVAFSQLECSPQQALIHSLQAFAEEGSSDEMSKIWKLLDETIERCMRTPYKYVDYSREHDFLSPFTMALAEQWNYVDKSSSYEQVTKWICIYLRTMVICGESQQGTMSVVQTSMSDLPKEYVANYLGFDKYEETLRELCEHQYQLSRLSDSSFFELIALTPYSALKRISRYPTNRFDAVGLQFRLYTLINQTSILFNTYFEEVVYVLIDQLANYSMVDTSFKFMNSKLIKLLFSQILSTEIREDQSIKCIFVANEMMKVNNNAINDAPFEAFAYAWIQDNKEYLSDDDKSKACFTILLCKSLLEEHRFALLEFHDAMTAGILKAILQTLVDVEGGLIPFHIIMALLHSSDIESMELACHFIEHDQVSGIRPETLLHFVLGKPHLSPAVESFLRSSYFSMDIFLPYLSQIKDDDISLRIASVMTTSGNEVVDEFLNDLVKKCLKSFKTLDIGSSQRALNLFESRVDLLPDNERSMVLEYVLSDYKEKYSAPVIGFATVAASFKKPEVLKWLGKVSLFITKIFTGVEGLSEQLFAMLAKMQYLTTRENIWKKVPASILNTQLEAILSGSYIGDMRVLDYVCRVLQAADSKSLECSKILQCFLSNEHNPLSLMNGDDYSKFLSSAIIFILFELDHSKCSSATTQRKLLEFYTGTLASHDRVILKVLEVLESYTNSSWTSEVFMWDLLENEEEGLETAALICRKKEGLIVAFKTEAIANTVSNYVVEKPIIPSFISSNAENSWNNVKQFFIQNERVLFGIDKNSYDPMFLLLSTVHNEELVRKVNAENGSVKYIFNVKAFLDSKMFQLVICALADAPIIRDIALNLVMGMLTSLEEKDQLKDNNTFKVLLKRIVFTFTNQSEDQCNKGHPIASCIWQAIASLCDQLMNPSSNLYEKSYRWVYSCPFIRYNDFPMLQELMIITNSQTSELEHYYRQLGWVIDSLNRGVKTSDDVDLLKKKGVLEWLSNLMNVPYLNPKLFSSINSIFYLVQRTGNSGSTLITRAASISNLEVHSISLEKKLLQSSQELHETTQNKRHIKKKLILEQAHLNVNELLEGHAVLVNSQKRLLDWADGDANNLRKRLKL